jgi:hypothetical protein
MMDIKRRMKALKNFFEPGLGPEPLPLELRVAVVDDIERHVTVTGLDQRVFPYERIDVRLIARTERDKAPLRKAFADLESRVRERFREMRCDMPAGLAIHVLIVKRRPATWAEDQSFSVEYDSSAKEGSEPKTGRRLRLEVLEGGAAAREYSFSYGTTIRVGRLREVDDARGGTRLNDIAFDERSSSISRAHATIKYRQDRDAYYVIDERSARGTRLVRAGQEPKPVPQDLRGVRLQSGDELRLGDARIRIILE